DFHEVEVWGGLQAMLDCDVPLLAQIEGACMGAGLEIASCCDIRLADASAKFGAPIAKLGFPMAPREAQLVVHAAGLLTAREMLLQAAVLDAVQMQQRGFLNRVIAGGQVRQEALEGARRIAGLAPQAARANKRLLRAISEENQAPVTVPRTQCATETIANAYRYADGPEHREGIAAFLEKRKPAF
ncbi:MAG: enoyl-CoA hydratase/isomerase family protein, partial [Comamonadaceae bacterium]